MNRYFQWVAVVLTFIFVHVICDALEIGVGIRQIIAFTFAVGVHWTCDLIIQSKREKSSTSLKCPKCGTVSRFSEPPDQLRGRRLQCRECGHVATLYQPRN